MDAKMKKRILAWLMVLALCLTLMPAWALAENLAENPAEDGIPDIGEMDSGAEEAAPVEEAADNPSDGDLTDEPVAADDPENADGQDADASGASDGQDPDVGPVNTDAEDELAAFGPEAVTGTLDNLPDSDTLFARYVDAAFGISTGSPVRLRRAGLSGQDAALYGALEPLAAGVANGELDYTVFQIPLSALGVQVEYTPAELGLEAVTYDNFNTEVKAAMYANFTFNFSAVMSYLAATKPYELYWFDSNVSFSCSYPSYGSNFRTVWFSSDYVTVSLCVSADYSATGERRTYDVNTGKTAAASNAAAAAAGVVDSYKNLSDYEKLLAYKNYICGEVEYNSAAAQNASTPYGDPWQLIYVFDGDDSTNVVCEGYSKAFKYLCDLTDWRGNVSCITVSGTMNGGNHMWNIVTIGGKNYMADITNSDDRKIGWNGQLFLTGYSSGSAADGYVFGWDSYQIGNSYYNGASILYVYDEDTGNIYDEELILSAEDYDPNAGPAVVSVTFVLNDGNGSTETVSVESGSAVERPEDPTYGNYHAAFLGWYTDEGLTEEYDFASPVTEDMTLYARWIGYRAGKNLVIGESITINYRMYALTDSGRDVTASDFGKFTVVSSYNDGEGTRTALTAGMWKDDRYVVPAAKVYSYEMTVPVCFSVYYDGVSEPIGTEIYSVQTYFLKQIGSGSASQSLKAVCCTALDYGAAAQIYFKGQNYTTTGYDGTAATLANYTVNPNFSVSATQPARVRETSGALSAVEKVSFSLLLREEIKVKMILKPANGEDLSALTVTCHDDEGREYPVSAMTRGTDGRYSVIISDIPAYYMYRPLRILISDGQDTQIETYSIYSYCANKWSEDNGLGLLCRSLVAFGDASRTYWGT